MYAHPRRSLAHGLGTILRLSSGALDRRKIPLSSRSLRFSRPRIPELAHGGGLWLSIYPTGRRCGTPTLLEDDGPIFPAGQNVANLMRATDPNERNMIFSCAGSVARPVVSGWCQHLRIRQEESLCTLPICCDGASVLVRVVSRASASLGRDYTRCRTRTSGNYPYPLVGE